MDLFKLNHFMTLERSICPWLSTQSMQDIISELKSEILELEAEMVKDNPNSTNIAEELADVLSDVLLLMHVAERDIIIKSKEDIVDRAYNKKIRRKGWLLENKQLSLQEASNYWHHAKDMEKKEQNN